MKVIVATGEIEAWQLKITTVLHMWPPISHNLCLMCSTDRDSIVWSGRCQNTALIVSLSCFAHQRCRVTSYFLTRVQSVHACWRSDGFFECVHVQLLNKRCISRPLLVLVLPYVRALATEIRSISTATSATWMRSENHLCLILLCSWLLTARLRTNTTNMWKKHFVFMLMW